ncbi:hypothetical protein SAMN02745220_04770 [Desulfopila aestuarii DSM 18488]|uniref:HD-GYP domain-containing protein n=1 Tax=Desulfopila aestuarii DSM 18488 TaxID=1121416 RepID=A0A1M7YJS8_9BACT|nr:hypothetical protein [Desulfopila aestuarii]SHO52798.1 hypothetical protein SAMN02745220_04770 [Desulfopila aestuarii DSM 18488]
MNKQIQVYGVFVIILSLAPVMRDLIGVMFATTPGPVLHDTFWHTFLEVVFMLALTTVLALFHAGLARRNSEKVRMTQIVSIEALASLAEFRDEETASHLRRIRKYVDILVSSIDRTHAYWPQVSKTANYAQEISDAAVPRYPSLRLPISRSRRERRPSRAKTPERTLGFTWISPMSMWAVM